MKRREEIICVFLFHRLSWFSNFIFFMLLDTNVVALSATVQQEIFHHGVFRRVF